MILLASFFSVSLAATPLPKLLVGPENYEMVLISSGSFTMGSAETDQRREQDETAHQVTLRYSYYIGKYEVTQQFWGTYARNKSKFQGAKKPASNMNWLAAIQFANDVSKAQGLEECYKVTRTEGVLWPKGINCSGYRLPTEAEWERAAQGGAGGVGGALLDIAWVQDNSNGTTHDVGTKKPNGFGLHDMLGNVWEWVWDLQQDFTSKAVVNPTGAKRSKKNRNFNLRRGGGYSTAASRVRLADRYALSEDVEHSFLGFRLVRTAPK